MIQLPGGRWINPAFVESICTFKGGDSWWRVQMTTATGERVTWSRGPDRKLLLQETADRLAADLAAMVKPKGYGWGLRGVAA
jgi:hypothetical protein